MSCCPDDDEEVGSDQPDGFYEDGYEGEEPYEDYFPYVEAPDEFDPTEGFNEPR